MSGKWFGYQRGHLKLNILHAVNSSRGKMLEARGCFLQAQMSCILLLQIYPGVGWVFWCGVGCFCQRVTDSEGNSSSGRLSGASAGRCNSALCLTESEWVELKGHLLSAVRWRDLEWSSENSVHFWRVDRLQGTMGPVPGWAGHRAGGPNMYDLTAAAFAEKSVLLSIGAFSNSAFYSWVSKTLW